ncbi:hypothetical protein G7054_g14691 [Neopestalotiopsis clavispora]|nr:hypothetical protein G7054_g14691 [Neopestalotiopsis clavispora]
MSLKASLSRNWFLPCFCRCGNRAHEAVTECFRSRNLDPRGGHYGTFYKFCLLVQVFDHVVCANQICQRSLIRATLEFVEFTSGKKLTGRVVLSHHPLVRNYTVDQLDSIALELSTAVYHELKQLDKEYVPWEMSFGVEQIDGLGRP